MIRSAGLRLTARSLAALAALCCLIAAPAAPAAAPTPAFGHAVVVQRDGNPLLLVDGEPFFFWGGAFFYERIPAANWESSMRAMRELGANTLDLYVPWNWHELSDGEFDFDGHTDPRRNLREVLRLGAELGFRFIVRPGPVIRNEWRNGGYPAWLLTRPEYDMPLHDVLEGRYPATATLQNAHSDDAAAEWMRNATHLRYASRWLHRALEEFRPYADRVIAVQLDDDQGAYIDNQTYPAPNLHRYLGWLDAQVRDVVGPLTPTFINTYQMRVPASSPVWTMGNWYQSDAYTIGMHDRVELDFSTLLLATNRRGPLAQSEFQAGWLAGPEDPQPRPADPRNTTLALFELLGLGVQGVIDFPMQDTRAEPGWEAPFSNASYAWDAALPQTSAGRFLPTYRFGNIVARIAPIILVAHRVAPIAVAYAEPPPRADSRPPDGVSAATAAVRAALATCIDRGVSCDVLDATQPSPNLSSYRTIVVPAAVAAAAPSAVDALRARAARARIVVVATVPQQRGPKTLTLAGPLGRVTIFPNWSDQRIDIRGRGGVVSVPPHDVALRIADVALSALGADPRDRRRVSSSDCSLVFEAPTRSTERDELLLRSANGCRITIRDGTRTQTVSLAAGEPLLLPSLGRIGAASGTAGGTTADSTTVVERTGPRYDDGPGAQGGAIVAQRPSERFGGEEVILRNDRLRAVIDPQAGARIFELSAVTPSHVGSPVTLSHVGSSVTLSHVGSPVTLSHVEGSATIAAPASTRANAADATGMLRDDLSEPVAPSPRDYIAKYTHGYPAGTFNRAYAVEVLASGPRAAVRFTYAMPDAVPSGVKFERIVSLEPHSSRLIVDERLVAPPGTSLGRQRIVVRSSLPSLYDGRSVALPAGDLPAATTVVSSDAASPFMAVAWRPGDIERATWTPYRSTGTLALTLAPGWRRTTYAYGIPESDSKPGAAQRFAEAEAAWVAANPPTGR